MTRSKLRPTWVIVAIGLVVAIVVAVIVWKSRGEPTPIGPRIAITATPAAGDDAWFAPPLARMLGTELERNEQRAYTIVDDPTASQIAIDYHRDGDGWRLVARHGDRELARGTGPSIREAIVALAKPLISTFEPGPPALPSAAESTEMTRIGAPNVVAYRRFKVIRDDWERSWFADPAAPIAAFQVLMRDEPRWLYPCLQLAFVQGIRGGESARTLQSCRSRDTSPPLPAVLLAALSQEPTPAAYRTLLGVPGARQDRLGITMLAPMASHHGELDELIALTRPRIAAHPELQFGSDLIFALRRAGREVEAEAFIRQWAAERPEAEHALTELVALEIKTGARQLASDVFARRRALLGESADALPMLFDTYVLLDELLEASRLVDRMLGSEGLLRARGRFRAGVLAIIDGRFAAAFDTLERAAVETAPWAMVSELTQVLTARHAIAPLAGTATDTAQLLDRRIEAFHFDPATAAALRYERDSIASSACPSLDDALRPLDVAGRATARRRMLRAARTQGCATCAEVVAAGMASDESNAESLLRFATCAETTGDLDLAHRASERAALPTTLQVEPSPYHWIIAELQLARVLVKQGDPTRARALYERFIKRWSTADRVIPEVAEAKAEFARLGKLP